MEVERLENVLKVIFLFNNVSRRMSLSVFSFRQHYYMTIIMNESRAFDRPKY